MDAFSLMTGVGTLYIADALTAPPSLGSSPSGSWRDLGETQDGVEADPSQKVEEIRVDQRTGIVKAVRTEEGLKLKTKLALLTAENLADVLGNPVTDTAPGSGTIGTRKVNLYRGATVAEYALLFEGDSPYLDGPGYFYIPRVYIDPDAIKFDKGKNAALPLSFIAMENLSASSADERFGYFIAKDAAAL